MKEIFEEKRSKRKEKSTFTRTKDINQEEKKAKKNLFKSGSSESSTEKQVPYGVSSDSDIENIETPPNNPNKREDQSLCTMGMRQTERVKIVI